MTIPEHPQAAAGLRRHLAEAMAKEAGSKAFVKPDTDTAWDHARSAWLAHAGAAVNALHRWEQEGTLIRLCVIPGCYRQLNIGEVEPGWMQSRAVGYACPDHAPVLWGADAAHVPNWGYANPGAPAGTEALLRCSCGWNTGSTRFRGHGTTLWQVHALEVLEAGR